MIKLKKGIALLLSTLMILGLTACSSKNENNINGESNNETSLDSDSHYPVTITTYNYKNEPVDITFDKVPEKVVAVYQNSIETLLALGLEDKIEIAAGLDHEVKDEYKDAFSKVNYIEEFTPSKETVVMEQPDFILSWYSLFSDKNLGDVDYWHQNNINTYMALNSGAAQDRTLENEKADILNLGKIFNVEDKAEKIVNNMQSKIDKALKAAEGQDKQNVLMVEFLGDEISNYGANSLGGDMITSLGGNLVAKDQSKLGKEDIVSLNPDVIYVVYMPYSGDDPEQVKQDALDKLLEDKAFSSLDAVKNKRVVPIMLGDMYASGVRTINGIETISAGLYPDLNK